MIQHRIAVYSNGRDLAERLRGVCPAGSFEEGERRSRCRIAVIDSDSHALLDSGGPSNLVRVILCDGSTPPVRRNGEIRVDRTAFLASVSDYLEFADDLASAAAHATRLEEEVGYLTQIKELMSLVDAEAVSERITKTVLDLLGLVSASLLLHDPRLERYVVSFSTNGDSIDSEEFLPGIPTDVLQRALESRDLMAEQRNDEGEGLIVMPLQIEDDLIGVIKLPLRKDDRVTEEGKESVTRYLSAVAQVLGNVYQLTRSRDLAMRDDLTKAFNRRFFESYLDEEIERSRRYGTLFSIIFLDLDDLKMVNNYYGHLTGSRVLQEVAKRMLSAVRGIDKVVRFGGDEFCIILPQTDQEQAIAVANRVRKAMTAGSFHIEPDLEISITASFGIATYPTHAVTKEGLIRQADAAMYRVKSTTKNAVGIASLDEATRPVAQST